MAKIQILLLGLVFLVSCNKQTSTETETFYVSTIRPVLKQTSTEIRSYPFISSPYNSSDLSFRIGGPIGKTDIQVGEFYKQGDILLEMDVRDFKINLQRCEAIYERTKEDFIRMEALYQKGNISKSKYEQAKSEFHVAESELEQAKNAVNDTKLVAPFDGYVQSVFVEPYQEVRQSETVISFIDINRLKVEVYIPEETATVLRNKQDIKENITISFDSDTDMVIIPSEVYISQNTVSNRLSYKLTAIISNTNNKLLGGMSGQLKIHMPLNNKNENSLFLPQSAICNSESQGTFVWVLNNGTALRKSVKIGDLINSQIEILEGINISDTIISSRQGFLSEGCNIKPVNL